MRDKKSPIGALRASLGRVWTVGGVGSLVVCFLVLHPAWESFPQGGKPPSTSSGESIKGFRVPDYNEDGSLKSILHGSTAEKDNRSEVWHMTGVKIDVFSSNRVAAIVTSPDCRFDQRRGRAVSDGRIVILHERAEILGSGYVWDQKKETFNINSNVTVRIRGGASELPRPDAKPTPGKP